MIKYLNRYYDIYYLHEGLSKKGNPVYWFSKKADGKPVDEIPKGFEIYEEPNGMVFLRKIKPKTITDEEVSTVVNSIPKRLDIKVDVKKSIITIWRRDKDYTSYMALMRFILIDKKTREFEAQRYCFRGSIDDWIEMGSSTDLHKLAAKYCYHLGKDSFYDLPSPDDEFSPEDTFHIEENEGKSQLVLYIIALCNLYGMVHKSKVVEIFNSQNKEQISLQDVENLLEDPLEELEDAFILTHKDYFVHEAIMENDDFDLMLRKKGDKPYYVPNKNELLNYAEEWYFEESKQYNALLEYMRKNFFKGQEEKAEWLCEDIYDTSRFDRNINNVFDVFKDRNIRFESLDQANEVLQLVMDLSNNIRVWENNGHTPQEIFEKIEKPKLRPLPDKPFNIPESNVIDMKTRKKIGRNDPCPCGSGKKYKNCCLGKGK